MKKLFISQPMKGKTDEEILAVREKAIRSAEKCLGEEVQVIDSFFQNTIEAKPLWYLGKSLELLATADIAFFAKGWENARGCKIENQCAIEYGIMVIEDYTEKTICRAEYDRAVEKVLNQEITNSNLCSDRDFLIPIMGAFFARRIGDELFNKEEQSNG